MAYKISKGLANIITLYTITSLVPFTFALFFVWLGRHRDPSTLMLQESLYVLPPCCYLSSCMCVHPFATWEVLCASTLLLPEKLYVRPLCCYLRSCICVHPAATCEVVRASTLLLPKKLYVRPHCCFLRSCMCVHPVATWVVVCASTLFLPEKLYVRPPCRVAGGSWRIREFFLDRSSPVPGHVQKY